MLAPPEDGTPEPRSGMALKAKAKARPPWRTFGWYVSTTSDARGGQRHGSAPAHSEAVTDGSAGCSGTRTPHFQTLPNSVARKSREKARVWTAQTVRRLSMFMPTRASTTSRRDSLVRWTARRASWRSVSLPLPHAHPQLLRDTSPSRRVPASPDASSSSVPCPNQHASHSVPLMFTSLSLHITLPRSPPNPPAPTTTSD